MRTSKQSRRDNPPPAERREIARRISLLRLMRPGVPGVLDWPGLAGRLAEELRELARRLEADDDATDADRERVARAAVVLRDFREASTAEQVLYDAERRHE